MAPATANPTIQWSGLALEAPAGPFAPPTTTPPARHGLPTELCDKAPGATAPCVDVAALVTAADRQAVLQSLALLAAALLPSGTGGTGDSGEASHGCALPAKGQPPPLWKSEGAPQATVAPQPSELQMHQQVAAAALAAAQVKSEPVKPRMEGLDVASGESLPSVAAFAAAMRYAQETEGKTFAAAAALPGAAVGTAEEQRVSALWLTLAAAMVADELKSNSEAGAPSKCSVAGSEALCPNCGRGFQAATAASAAKPEPAAQLSAELTLPVYAEIGGNFGWRPLPTGVGGAAGFSTNATLDALIAAAGQGAAVTPPPLTPPPLTPPQLTPPPLTPLPTDGGAGGFQPPCFAEPRGAVQPGFGNFLPLSLPTRLDGQAAEAAQWWRRGWFDDEGRRAGREDATMGDSSDSRSNRPTASEIRQLPPKGWSHAETESLVAGMNEAVRVRRKWSYIKQRKRLMKNNVQIKDKWRNLVKYGRVGCSASRGFYLRTNESPSNEKVVPIEFVKLIDASGADCRRIPTEAATVTRQSVGVQRDSAVTSWQSC